MEGKAADKQLEYLNGNAFKKLNDTVTEVAAKIVEEEAAGTSISISCLISDHIVFFCIALAAVQPVEGAEPPPPEIAEFIKPKTDTAAIVGAWNKAVGGGSIGPQLNSLQQYVLPLPSSALKLFNAVALLLNYDPATVQDVTGEITWELFKKVSENVSDTFLLVLIKLFKLRRISYQPLQHKFLPSKLMRRYL